MNVLNSNTHKHEQKHCITNSLSHFVSQFNDVVHFQNLLMATNHSHCVWIQSGIDKAASANKSSWQSHYNAECEPGVTFETEWQGVSISDAADNTGNMVCCKRHPLPAVFVIISL